MRYLLAAAFVWLAWRAMKATPRGRALIAGFAKAFAAKQPQAPHLVLGVAKDAPVDDVRRAYRALAKKNHPDVVPEADRDDAEERMVRIQSAYEQLKKRKS